jgi:hypothetical protein
MVETLLPQCHNYSTKLGTERRLALLYLSDICPRDPIRARESQKFVL